MKLFHAFLTIFIRNKEKQNKKNYFKHLDIIKNILFDLEIKINNESTIFCVLYIYSEISHRLQLHLLLVVPGKLVYNQTSWELLFKRGK